MERFSIDNKKFKKFKFWQNLYLIFYIVIMLFLLVTIFILPHFGSQEVRWNPDFPTLAKMIVFSLASSFLILAYFLTRQLVRLNKYLNKAFRSCTNLTIEVDDTTINVITRNSSYELVLDEIELHNYIFNTGLKNSFFGQGFLVLVSPQKQKVVISSLIFDFNVGAYIVRDLFKHRNNYKQLKLKWKNIDKVYH